jgi:pimeloyl-ACP methyl ester carboxylesterase
VIWLLAVLVVIAVAGLMFQSVGTARDARRFPPPGRLIDVDGRRLHVRCEGQGFPAVLLESAIAASSLSWARVQPLVSSFARVCAYDRAGFAWSDPPRERRTFESIVGDLTALMSKLDYREPCVFVGHSFGVFICLAYAARYPHRVAGLVLVDPPSEWMAMNRRQSRMVRGGAMLSRVGGVLARVGVVRTCSSAARRQLRGISSKCSARRQRGQWNVLWAKFGSCRLNSMRSSGRCGAGRRVLTRWPII